MPVQFADQARSKVLGKALDEIVGRLATLDVERIILFGSYARGEVGRSTDLDLIVVMRTELRFLDRLDLVYRTAQPTVACDFLVYTPEELETLPATSDLVRTALREGKVVYEKERPSGGQTLAGPGRP